MLQQGRVVGSTVPSAAHASNSSEISVAQVGEDMHQTVEWQLGNILVVLCSGFRKSKNK